MRRIFSGLMAIIVVALALLPLTACQSKAATSPSTTDPGFSTPLTLDQARQQLKQTGSTVVDTVEKASKLAGYPIATPAFIPKGFSPSIITSSSAFYISYVAFGAPGAPTSLPEFPYDIQVTYSPNGLRPDSTRPFFMTNQSRNHVQSPGDEPVNIGNLTGKKQLIPATENNTARLTLSWNDGTMYYVLSGTLVAPLDEATLIKIAASMRVP